MNPEFKRNIWQELTPQRLISMPAILLAIFFVAYLKSDFSVIPEIALIILFLLLSIWGSGLAADAIFEEIHERTWDAQRMTPLTPWSMAWGKLFGSTVFVWYGALCCLIAVWISARQTPEIDLAGYFSITQKSIYFILTGVFAQAFALFVALLFQRISPLRTRSKVVLIQLFAIATTGILFVFGKKVLPEIFKYHTWYNLNITSEQFALGSQLFLCASLIFGIYRLLRAELQIRNFPWGWPVFLLLWIIYLSGFVVFIPGIQVSGDETRLSVGFLPGTPVSGNKAGAIYFWIAYFVMVKGTFLSAFFAPKNIVHYFRWRRYLSAGKFKGSLALTPPWMITIVVAFLFLFPLVFFLYSLQLSDSVTTLPGIALCITSFFFLIRDLGLLYYLTFDFKAKRAHLATIVYLIVLYTLLPMLLGFTGLHPYWFPALAPWRWMIPQIEPVTWTQIAVVVFLVALQAGVAWGLVASRWRAAAKTIELKI